MKNDTFTFSFKDAFEEFGKSIENLTQAMQVEVSQAVADLAESTYASIVAEAQAKLKTTRQDYLSGLQLEVVGNGHYIISLEGDWPNALEAGFPSFDLSKAMLNSDATVSTGERAGQPWVRRAKDGHKYASVPVKRGSASSMGAALQEVRATNIRNRQQKITSTFTDAKRNPMSGKVAVGRGPEGSSLQGVVKYQRQVKTSTGKQRTESLYVLYRTVSENGKPWIHPGYGGLHAFQKAEADLKKNLDAIVKAFIGRT